MKIFLLGLPCCGKTTIGKKLAEQLKISFIDLDEVIVESEQMSVSEIFLRKGESFFRELESKKLKSIARSNTDFLMATGGGTPCFENNMDIIEEHGKSIFLNLSVEEIVKRLSNVSLLDRPLLSNVSREDRIKKFNQLLKIREKSYRRANYTLSGLTSISPQQLLNIIKTEFPQ